MKRVFIYSFLGIAFFLKAQQTSNYVQYIFNKAVNNPAASGTNINQKVYYTFGAHRQWFQIDNSPKQTFANFSYTIRPPRSYSYWQNIGATVERDQAGVMSNNSYYLNYTIHLLLRQNLVASFGVHAGFRKFYLSPNFVHPDDPVMQGATFQAYSYPDLIPGVRLSNNKFFFDLSARQVSVLSQRDYFSSGNIAGGSRLNPTIFMAYGTVIGISDHWIMLPSIALNGAIISIPAVNPTLMFYYNNRIGLGAATRNLSFASFIFQAKIVKNLSVGFAYSYSTNHMAAVAPHNYEIMVGVSPMGMSDKQRGRHSVAKCPALDF